MERRRKQVRPYYSDPPVVPPTCSPPDWLQGFYFGRYLQYARAISNTDNESAVAILNSFPMGGFAANRKPSRFSQDVKRRLEELGHIVSLEIGSSGFFIEYK